MLSTKHSWLKHIDFIAIDLLSLVVSFVVACAVRFGGIWLFADQRWVGLGCVLVVLNLVITFLMNPYSGVFRRAYYEDLLKMLLLALYGFISACVFFYIFKLGEEYSRLALAGTYVLYFVMSFVLKCIRKKWLLSRSQKQGAGDLMTMLVIAEHGAMAGTLEYINSTDFKQYEIVGLSFYGDDTEGTCEGIPVVPFSKVVDYATRTNLDDVFVGIAPTMIDSSVYEALVSNGVVVHLNIECMLGIQSDEQSVQRVGVYKTLNVAAYTGDSRKLLYFAVKRVIDIVCAIVGCILLAPIMLVTKLSYMASGDRAPVLYKQTRVGLRGHTFQMYKIRSMVGDADEVLQQLLQDPARRAEWDETQKFEDDPRITKVGAFLRKTSLDEFPQFINILKGEMSLVGPRPLVEGELEEHGGLSLYNKVKPGLTGWWGCNGRSNINYRERLELEYHYVKHCSLYMDLLCVLRTFGAVVKREGAK